MIDFRRLHANAPGGPTGVAIGPVDPKVWLPNPAGKSMWWQPSQPVEGTCQFSTTKTTPRNAQPRTGLFLPVPPGTGLPQGLACPTAHSPSNPPHRRSAKNPQAQAASQSIYIYMYYFPRHSCTVLRSRVTTSSRMFAPSSLCSLFPSLVQRNTHPAQDRATTVTFLRRSEV